MKTKKKFFKGVAYVGAAKYIGILWGVIIAAVLARLLTPSDFGTVAVATVFISFFYLLSDFGIGSAIIQFHDLTDEDLGNLFGWTLWLGLLLSLIFYAISPLISNFYNIEQLKPICQLLSLQILFSTINVIPNSLLMRDKKFRTVAFRNVTIQIICGLISMWGAFHGMGIYALLVNPILGAILTFCVNEIKVKLKLRVIPSLNPLKRIFKFSIYQFLFSFVNYFGNNLDKLIIGKTISVKELGYYEKAGRLISMPISTLNGVFDPVLQSFMADMQNDKDSILSVYTRMNKILLTISLPLSVVLFLCAKEIVLIIFGEQWVPSIMPFAIVALPVGFRIATSPTGGILQSCKRTDILFRLGTLNVLTALIGLMIGAFIYKSIIAICVCGAISSFICFFNSYIAAYHFCFKSSVLPILKFGLEPLAFSTILLVLGLIINSVIGDMNLIVSLIIKLLFCGVLYICYLQLFTQYKPAKYIIQIRQHFK